MPKRTSYKGHYCARCHTYSRIYLDPAGHAYIGTCPRCGERIRVPLGEAEDGLFHTGGQRRERLVNVWDHYEGGNIIGQVAAGTPAKVITQVRHRAVTWYKVKTGSLEGWISGSFVRKLRR